MEGPANRTSNGYDPLHRITDIRDASGGVARIEYDAAGRLKRVTAPGGSKLAYSYNGQGLLSAVRTSSGDIGYSYDRAGRLTQIDYPNKTRTSYRYVAGMRLLAIATTDGRGELLLSEEYEYDVRGNIAAVTSKGRLAGSADDRNALRGILGRSEYDYDALNRVVAARFPDGTSEHFSYDAAGNMVKQIKETTRSDGTKSTVVTPYAYDADQALVKRRRRVAARSKRRLVRGHNRRRRAVRRVMTPWAGSSPGKISATTMTAKAASSTGATAGEMADTSCIWVNRCWRRQLHGADRFAFMFRVSAPPTG